MPTLAIFFEGGALQRLQINGRSNESQLGRFDYRPVALPRVSQCHDRRPHPPPRPAPTGRRTPEADANVGGLTPPPAAEQGLPSHLDQDDFCSRT